jgi:hypothetical protein
MVPPRPGRIQPGIRPMVRPPRHEAGRSPLLGGAPCDSSPAAGPGPARSYLSFSAALTMAACAAARRATGTRNGEQDT